MKNSPKTFSEYSVQYRFRPHESWQTLNMYDSRDKANAEMSVQKALAEKMGPAWAQYWRIASREVTQWQQEDGIPEFIKYAKGKKIK